MAETNLASGKVLCVKRKEDIRQFEATEDCFILDSDPFDTIDLCKISLESSEELDRTGIAVLAEKGQVACRDYPHPRHLCQKFPFATTAHQSYCEQCYCCICDMAEPCESWTLPKSGHCHATREIAP
ncbi:uncharacterized protein LOC116208858 [Punica granatum]|uniref:Uncharacterized protein n=2 Tax=Punica granatum TaxID=22663 RepID=A0A218XAJ2_PUNGR|nr:uncharacterized protein LOC116208858 [Punica granatum]OWM81963.1 hypothetical protein CDL15_Pgr027161 [Punica granatum]PKI55056.1 hypothetical protein CRG98_024563 [Punica granatum]